MTANDGNPPVPRWFEEFQGGQVWEFGAVAITEEAILEFARRYDPQPMHVDPAAAARTVHGGLIASGWHTGSESVRLFVDHILSKTENLGSPGLDEVRWPRPVRPGDVLSVRFSVTGTAPSRSKPDRGVVSTRVETLNQRGEVVMSYAMVLILRRRGAPA